MRGNRDHSLIVLTHRNEASRTANDMKDPTTWNSYFCQLEVNQFRWFRTVMYGAKHNDQINESNVVEISLHDFAYWQHWPYLFLCMFHFLNAKMNFQFETKNRIKWFVLLFAAGGFISLFTTENYWKFRLQQNNILKGKNVIKTIERETCTFL